MLLKILHVAPSGPPSKLRIVAATATTATLAWNPVKPEERNGQIIGYHYRLQLGENTLENRFLEGEQTTNVTLFFPRHCKHCYSFTVAAANTAGIGPENRMGHLGVIYQRT